MNLENVHWLRRLTVRLAQRGCPGKARDTGDNIRELTGHPIGHEPPIRVTEQIDPPTVDLQGAGYSFNQAMQIAGIIDTSAEKVAAGIGGIPETIAKRIRDPVRAAIDKPP